MSRIKTAVEDLSQLGHIGIIRALVGVIVVLAALIVFREVQHERGVLKMTDRWTGTDQKAYELVVNRRFDKLETAFDAHVIWGREWIGAHEQVPHGSVGEQLKEISDRQTEILQRLSRIEAKQGQ
jgi:hypothetical protein